MIAYFDESGKHLESKVITMAGVLASSREWRKLGKKWDRVLVDEGVQGPFHAADCEYGWGAFRDMDGTKRERIQERLIEALVSIDFCAYGSSVIRKDHDAVLVRLRNRKVRDPWFLAFENAIQEMVHRSAEEVGKTASINFVFDRQDEFSNRAKELYDMILEQRDKVPHGNRLGTLTFAPKDTFYQLQAADLIVYEVNRSITDCKLGGKPERWQMVRLRKRPINGVVWERHRLAELAELVEEAQINERAGSPKTR